MSPRTSSLALTLLPLLALAVPRLAAAQSITLNISGQSAVSVNSDDCAVQLTVNWTATATGVTPCSELTVWVTSQSTCANAPPATGDQLLGTVAQNTWVTQGTGTFNLPVSGLPVFGTSTCPVANVEQTMRVCAHAKYNNSITGTCGSGDADLKPSSPPTIFYDTKAPVVPGISSVGGLDGALQVAFTTTSDASQVIVYFRPDGTTTDFVEGARGPVSSGIIRQGGLTNGVRYEVRIKVEDAAGNLSNPSGSAFATPQRSFGFFTTYQDAGGQEVGCAAAPAGALPLLALGWLVARRPRRRTSSGDSRP